MKKILFSFLLIFLTTLSYSQRTTLSSKKMTNDTIVWRQDSLLKMEDFKSKAKSGLAEGYACTGILLYPKEDNGVMNFYVEAIFVKSKSMMKDNTAYGIKHEQLHFDITELYARKLRQKLAQTDFKKIRNIVQEINGIYTRVSEELDKEQQKYDDDTQHGMNPAKQQVWEDTIKAELQGLDSYSATQVDITK